VATKRYKGHTNDDNGLLESAGPSGTKNKRLQDLGPEGSTERCKTRELDLLNELQGLVLGRDVVAFKSVVHESDLNTVLVE
jgi:hypothetical protein